MMIIRRYTPPTCTLEVQAKRPFISRLKQQPILEQFKFKLCFDDPRLPDADHITIEGDRTQLETLSQVIKNYIQNFLNFAQNSTREPTTVSLKSSTENTPSFVLFDETNSEIKIKPDGLLYHNLFLGNLAKNPTDTLIHLSILQLFDLSAALEEYITESENLPHLKSLEKITPEWLKTILFIAISIGCLTGTIRLINLYRQPQAQTATQPSETIPIPPPNLVPLPPPPPLAPLPVPSAPPVEIKVAPNLPPVNTAPLPIPAPLFPNPATPQVIPDLQAAPDGFVIIPQDSGINDGSVSPAPPPLTATVPPPPPRLGVAPTQVAPPSPPVIFAPQTIQLPTLKNASPPIILNVPSAENSSNSSPENSDPDEQNYLAQLNKRPPTIAATRQQDTTLFDQIPQVSEVRNYFQKIWYPPKNLKRTLQYSLQLNSDGSLQSIIPVGQPAVNRQKQLEFPEIGKPFVSPLESGKTPKIRLVLQPDGSVQAFLESLN